MVSGIVNDTIMVYGIRRGDMIDIFAMYNGIWYSSVYTRSELGENWWNDFSYLIEGELILLGDIRVLTESLFPEYVKITEDNFGDYIDLRISLIGSLLRKHGLVPTDNIAVVEIYKNMLHVLKDRDDETDRKKVEAVKEFLMWWKGNMWLDPYVESEIRMLLSSIMVFFNTDIEGWKLLNIDNERREDDSDSEI